ncbi:MAG: hypothetical protein M1816_007217 [Peltula sp. TS41687]|nr:MAG: hypothetical protein M1816_007217 [Peltula sp. TS41687]
MSNGSIIKRATRIISEAITNKAADASEEVKAYIAESDADELSAFIKKATRPVLLDLMEDVSKNAPFNMTMMDRHARRTNNQGVYLLIMFSLEDRAAYYTYVGSSWGRNGIGGRTKTHGVAARQNGGDQRSRKYAMWNKPGIQEEGFYKSLLTPNARRYANLIHGLASGGNPQYGDDSRARRKLKRISAKPLAPSGKRPASLEGVGMWAGRHKEEEAIYGAEEKEGGRGARPRYAATE